MNEQTLFSSLGAGPGSGPNPPPAQADVLLLQQLSREQLQARSRRFVGLLREQDGCPNIDAGSWKQSDDHTVIHLAGGARAVLYHASGALRYVSGLAPASKPFVRGTDRAGKQSETTLFRAIGAYRQFIGTIPVLGAASAAVQVAGDGQLDTLAILTRPANGEVLERAAVIEPQAGARRVLAQLSALLGQRDMPADAFESASMQFGYLDLGKRKPQRVLAPAYVAKIVLRHRRVRQAYVLAVAATERPYLDMPIFGNEAPVTRGRMEVGSC
ncbi:hypothetical protein ACI48D_11190 [Massilia sp. LXY-6]|uniref:hypothetical protein n=1 Tax=Massilia sp. LXY-6 TaxID=3379823 RepID=UPI003EE23D6C